MQVRRGAIPKLLLVVPAVLILVVGCGDRSDTVSASATTTTTAPVTTTTTTTQPPFTTTEQPPTPAVVEPEIDCSQPMAAPTDRFGTPMSNGTGACATVVACADISENYQFGTTHMSDGTLLYTADCNEYNQQQKAEQQAEAPVDPGTTADRGYTCTDAGCVYPDGSFVPGYQRCGVACGEPPTSGDVQGGWVDCLNTGATIEECREQGPTG